MGCLILLILLVGFPAAEFWAISKVAAQIGFWDTIILLILSAVFGAYLAKHQGNAVLVRIQRSIMEGRAPTFEMVDGVLIFLGGVLFIIPGFISDIIGFFLIFPLTRWLVRSFVLLALKARVQAGGFKPQARPAKAETAQDPRQGIDRGRAVDAEMVE
jgi:UPF0716 protein FxsA